MMEVTICFKTGEKEILEKVHAISADVKGYQMFAENGKRYTYKADEIVDFFIKEVGYDLFTERYLKPHRA